MSSSRHPRALNVERWVSSSTRLLAIVMALPLFDGVFVALVLGGALDTIVGIVEVGLLVFGGSAMVAVILAEMDESPREQAKIVLTVGAVLVTGAAIQAALAPTLATMLDIAVFERFAALVILSVAASTASSRVGEYLPGPGIIILLGLVASLSPSNVAFTVQTEPLLIARAMGAAGVGVGFALVLALTSPWLRNAVELDRFRFGSAVALGVLSLSVLGVLPSEAPVALLVLVVTAVLAFDPGSARERDAVYHPDDIDITAAMSDGGQEQGLDTTTPSDPSEQTQAPDPEPDERQERLPWL
ncbi:hypothetical protein GRX03_06020 [Halovenus sp. WSH3]|uniref:Uncharacterized protein n=1 Tax=Halovenus carboxidivorans TaxID=2692199 RepID=A0A6B0T6G1_9EURY|nr:DUF5794 domain-containing protein [Halovenus carboxidivorans]MXR51163.1 hypothetical protein [Halovenus carboxidivorans]